ncbi:MAG: hypothetical protein GKR89_00745 [Candidatus Latescibacteria bacterium]|nr:hypothetical protein [Candidatus Latescibacterota bacterium]
MARMLLVAIIGFLLAIRGAQAEEETAVAEVLAFVTEAKGKVQIGRPAGRVKASMGSELYAGDTLLVGPQGRAVVIYMTGRSAEVGAGQGHLVSSDPAESSALIERVMDTLKEIAGPQEDTDGPAVHGMARDLEVLGAALPTNTRLSGAGFHFSWEVADGASGYEFELYSHDGISLHRQMLETGYLSAVDLGLQAGRQYRWQVREKGTFFARTTGECLVELATAQEAADLERQLAAIAAGLSAATRSLLAAAAFYQGQYYYEAERALLDLQKERPLAPLERKLLILTYRKMQRWDLLAGLEEESQVTVGN